MLCQYIQPFFVICCIFFVGCGPNQEQNDQLNQVQTLLNELKTEFAPDSRDDIFDFRWSDSPDSKASDYIDLEGFTTSQAAFTALQKRAEEKGLPIRLDLTSLYPQSALGDTLYGVIKVSTANLRSKPGHSQELATQLLLGTPIHLLAHQDNWYLVRAPDNYLAWLDHGAIEPLNEVGLTNYLTKDLRFYIGTHGFFYAEPAQTSLPMLDITAGALVQFLGSESGWDKVQLPDNRIAYLPSGQLLTKVAWSERSAAAHPLDFSQQFLGLPYLWGGTSGKGVDCSGFTKMCYYLNGFVIPRDASQQVKAGIAVDIEEDLSDLETGDLLFFGRLREDGSPRITHVGIYTGGGRFVHSGADNGYVKEQSLLPESPDFAPNRRASLLRARRLSAGSLRVLGVSEFLSLEHYTNSSSR